MARKHLSIVGIALLCLGAWAQGALRADPQLDVATIRSEIARTGLPPADQALSREAVADGCANGRICQARALLAYMLMANAYMPRSPEEIASVGKLRIRKVYRNPVQYDESPHSFIDVPESVVLAAQAPDGRQAELGLLDLFDGPAFRVTGSLKTAPPNWPQDGTPFDEAFFNLVRDAYTRYRARRQSAS